MSWWLDVDRDGSWEIWSVALVTSIKFEAVGVIDGMLKGVIIR
jgi:hypothetical protein